MRLRVKIIAVLGYDHRVGATRVRALGSFGTFGEAVRARERAAKRYFGAFARERG